MIVTNGYFILIYCDRKYLDDIVQVCNKYKQYDKNFRCLRVTGEEDIEEKPSCIIDFETDQDRLKEFLNSIVERVPKIEKITIRK